MNNNSDIELRHGGEINLLGNPLSGRATSLPSISGIEIQFDEDCTRSPDMNNDGEVNVLDLAILQAMRQPLRRSRRVRKIFSLLREIQSLQGRIMAFFLFREV